jgi:hypothetical protein
MEIVVLRYSIKRTENSLTVFAGPLIDLDHEGVLEKTIITNSNDDLMCVRIVLDGVHFLHETLAICLIRIGRSLREIGGSLILVDTPWFLRTMLFQMEIDHLFVFSTSENEGLLFISKSSNIKTLMDETVELIINSEPENGIY